MNWMWGRKRFTDRTIEPDEIFLDSANVSGMDRYQLEGAIERPITPKVVAILGVFFCLVALVFIAKLWTIQIVQGGEYSQASERNRYDTTPILAERGVVFDRLGERLAWNTVDEDERPYRRYIENSGFAHVLGYTKPPAKDSSGFYYRDEHVGIEGIENVHNDLLNGVNGLRFLERDATGSIHSESIFREPESGENAELSIDSAVQTAVYEIIRETAEEVGYQGGAGVIMDIHTGELVVAVSFPEYDPQILADGEDSAAISEFVHDERRPFLNRFSGGVFTPGSVMKLFVAVGALEEEVVDPNTVLASPRQIVIPNPYDPARPTIFRDWQHHGSVDMRQAIAVSSNVYFYKIGGGFEGQEGLGISRIENYMRMFGFGSETGFELTGERSGVIPTPSWKQGTFKDDGVWRVGDTFNTAIGQYGFQTTPLQIVRATAALANDGVLVQPHLVRNTDMQRESLEVQTSSLQVVREGMRQAVQGGTAAGLNLPFVDVAAKTGTAQAGVGNQYMNSWITGFFPYDEPRYAFTILLDRGPSGSLRGGSYVMRSVLEWMNEHAPEYLESGL